MPDGADAPGGDRVPQRQGGDAAGAGSPIAERREAQEPLSPAALQQSEAAASLAALGAGPGASRRRAAEEAVEPASKVAKTRRLLWSAELHARFLAAVQHLGVNTAVPKTILQLMNVDGMTRENVASHLQKYRLALRKAAGIPADQPLPEDAVVRFGAATPAPVEADPAAPAATASAAAAPPPAPQHPGAGAGPPLAAPARGWPAAPQRRTSNHGLSSQELSSIATSASFAAQFAPGAGTRPPPPAVLNSFILGHADTFAAAPPHLRAEPTHTANVNNPPKPEREEAADAA